MGKLLPHRQPRPGETMLGGRGILVPYRPRYDTASSAPKRPVESSHDQPKAGGKR
jgi:hypothetical protein